MRPDEEIQAVLDAYLVSRSRPPTYIAIPPEKYRELKESVNSGLPSQERYSPSVFRGIPIVQALSERNIRCLP